jgi:hypothetical protein
MAELIESAKTDSVNRFRANMLVQVATLRLLIKAGITSVDAATEEIEKVRAVFSMVFGTKEISDGAEWAIDLLRGEVPLHGSLVQKHLQSKERARSASERPPL